MSTGKVVITDCGFPGVETERNLIEAAGGVLSVCACQTEEMSFLPDATPPCCWCSSPPISGRVLRELPDCMTIVRYGIGVDNVDLPAARQLDIAVANVPDYCIDEVADHSVALALARQLPSTDRRLRAGTWKITSPWPAPAFRGIVYAAVGMGRIGRAVLHRAQGFGFRLAAHDPVVPADVFAQAQAESLTLDEVFTTADIISLHSALTPQTRHMVSAERLRGMKKRRW